MSGKTKTESSLVVEIKDNNTDVEVIINNDEKWTTEWTMWTIYDGFSHCEVKDEKENGLLEIMEAIEKMKEIVLKNKYNVSR